MENIDAEQQCLRTLCKVLGGNNRRPLREKLCDARYFDKRLWKLTCYLISREKFNRKVAEKLVARRHPVYSQELLKREKLQTLIDLSTKKDNIATFIRFKFEAAEFHKENPVRYVMKMLRSNQPEMVDLAVRTLDALIENEVATIHREWRKLRDMEDEGFARMSYFESIPQEEWESETVRLTELDRKESCRIKRVP